MRNMRRWLAPSLAMLLSGCGFWADALSDELSFDFQSDVLEPSNVGQNLIAPVSFSVAATQDSPSYGLPPTDGTPFSILLLADQLSGSSQFAISAEGFTFSAEGDEPVEFAVEVSSSDGRYLGQDLGYVPMRPTSCTFVLDPTTDGATEYGSNMTACMRDFSEMNGAPLNLTYAVTTRSTVDTRAPGDYSVSHVETMSSQEELSFGSAQRFLSDLDEDVVENLDIASFSSLSMTGYGSSSETVLLAGVVQVYDAFGNSVASGSLFQTINEGEIYSLFTEYDNPPDGAENYTYAGNVSPTLTPASPQFEAEILRAARSGLGAPEGSYGASALAAWVVVGPAPRIGEVAITIEGRGGPRTDGEADPDPTGDYVYYDPTTNTFSTSPAGGN